MVASLSKLQILDCESCQLDKHVRSSFPKQVEKRYNSIFSTIHSDIWGPSRVTSYSFKCFDTFIDEYSRCTWIYLMKDRSELLSIFVSFFHEIKNQFVKIIKILEVTTQRNISLQNFLLFCPHMESNFIPHAHTPQQNGIAKRKNRHLVEIARTLLLDANDPVHHWGDAVLTACFLINRMPSSFLDNKTPHSIIFPNEHLYHVSPKVFGCTCFVHDVSPGLDKLLARAIKCVFLGYSCLQKGHKCYSPTTRRYYMSADVSFFEENMFFSKQESNSIQQVLPIPYLSPVVPPTHTTSNQGEIQPISPVKCELVWIKQLIQEQKFCEVQPMKLYCDNQAALHIVSDPVFHERTKHIEIDCHFVREKLLSKEIATEFVSSNNQLADILTKILKGASD